jgi:hypothetical protein
MIQATLNKLVSIPELTGVVIVAQQCIPVFYMRDVCLLPHHRQDIGQCLRTFLQENYPLEEPAVFEAHGYDAYAYPLKAEVILITLCYQANPSLKLTIAREIEDLRTASLNLLVLAFQSLPMGAKDLSISEVQSSIAVPAPSEPATMAINDVLGVLNQLSQLTSHYLGPKLTANFWQLSRPRNAWIQNFGLDQQAQFYFKEDGSLPMAAVQHLWIREWTNAFVQRSAAIIKNFPEIIATGIPDPNHRRLLSIIPAGHLQQLGEMSVEGPDLFRVHGDWEGGSPA